MRRVSNGLPDRSLIIIKSYIFWMIIRHLKSVLFSMTPHNVKMFHFMIDTVDWTADHYKPIILRTADSISFPVECRGWTTREWNSNKIILKYKNEYILLAVKRSLFNYTQGLNKRTLQPFLANFKVFFKKNFIYLWIRFDCIMFPMRNEKYPPSIFFLKLFTKQSR